MLTEYIFRLLRTHYQLLLKEKKRIIDKYYSYKLFTLSLSKEKLIIR